MITSVMAVAHHRGPAELPYLASGNELIPTRGVKRALSLSRVCLWQVRVRLAKAEPWPPERRSGVEARTALELEMDRTWPTRPIRPCRQL